MLTQNAASTTCFSGKHDAISRGTIHPAAKASGLFLPLDPINRNVAIYFYDEFEIDEMIDLENNGG